MNSVVLAAACVVAGAAAPALADQPPMPTQSADPERCTWQWTSGVLPMGGTIGAWTERCEFETGVWNVVFNDALPGLELTLDEEAQMAVVQVFAKPPDADIAAILPELRQRGYIPADECVFEPASDGTLMTVGPVPRTKALFEIMPVGARLAAFQATPDEDIPDPPCPDYGWSTHGIRYFMTDMIHPDKVAYFNLGQDGTMFDPKTVTLE